MFSLQTDWQKAAAMARILLNGNNWSKATYCYLLAIFLFEDNQYQPTEEIMKLFKRVPELKIRLAGKSIPLEKYAIRKCEHFLAQRWLFLPALVSCDIYESKTQQDNNINLFSSRKLFILSMAFLSLLMMNKNYNRLFEPWKMLWKIYNIFIKVCQKEKYRLQSFYILKLDNQYFADSYGSGLLLRGVLLHFLGRYNEAHQSLDEILQMFVQFIRYVFLFLFVFSSSGSNNLIRNHS